MSSSQNQSILSLHQGKGFTLEIKPEGAEKLSRTDSIMHDLLSVLQHFLILFWICSLWIVNFHILDVVEINHERGIVQTDISL